MNLGGAVSAFDLWADTRLEALRDNRVAAKVFASASELGNFSLIWHIVGAARGIASERNARQSIAFAALVGVESLVVNQGVKRLFRRIRPTETGDARFIVRRPSTSSFPSGHASSAFFAATLLSAWGGRRSAPAWFAVASVVAVSRVYVRVHHPSDVVAGAALGVALGRGTLAGLRAVCPE